MGNNIAAPIMEARTNGSIVSEPVAENDILLRNILKLQNQPEENQQHAIMLDRLRSLRLDLTKELTPPETCLELITNDGSSTLGTLGNFSLAIGKAKSRKTFFVTIALAAATSENLVLSSFKGTLPTNKKRVIYFDTEQGDYHVMKAAKRVMKMAGQEVPSNFDAYILRNQSFQENFALIEFAINNTPDLGFVVIDGIRDLVGDINDSKEASNMARTLLKWSYDNNIHILTVLHQNKGDNNARGHLGSELVNKAETVISITKDVHNRDISIVEAEYCREKDFAPFAFEIDPDGIPQLVDWTAAKESERKKSKGLEPQEIEHETHLKILTKAFQNNPTPKYKELADHIINAHSTEGNKFGDSKARIYIAYYIQEGYISQEGTPGTRSSHYILCQQ